MKLDRLTRNYVRRHRDTCARGRTAPWHLSLLAPGQLVWCLLGLDLMLMCVIWRWDIALYVVNFFFAALYFGIVLFRTLAVTLSFTGRGIRRFTASQPAILTADELPVYTILVPLYHEENIADSIVSALNRLDYPEDKLDIKLLLEEDDAATRTALAGLALPAAYDVVIAPAGGPKTKPRACNYGLERARGEYCVIYDAEDRPEPDQLRKAVLAFRACAPRVVCVQAKLNFYNARQNLLTRWFAVDYSTWFDLFLPGLQCLRVPIPLGGTSNHFRTAALRELDGWDPFNVTEDCDLGARIYQAGYRTEMIESTTWEEANCRLGNWLRQRSRWVKGFLQTHLAHTRSPWRSLRRLGPWGYFGFAMSVGGSSLVLLTNVIYWLLGAGYLGLLARGMQQGVHPLDFIIRGPVQRSLPSAFVLAGYEIRAWPLLYHGPKQDPLWSWLSIAFFVIACVLLAANALFVFQHVLACIKRRSYHLIPAAVLMPLYWVLLSCGAWKGFLQLLTRPFYWEKTTHGLAADDDTTPTTSKN